jgi:hypothetical protein
MGIVAGVAGLALVATMAVAVPVFANGGTARSGSPWGTARSGSPWGKTWQNGNVFVGHMNGSLEIPPAEPTATAEAVITLKPASTTVCFHLSWDGLTSVTAAHIHSGAADVTGSVVVPFFNGPIPDTISSVGGCVHDVDPALIKAIHDHPSDYYVNVHDAAFPGGAVRDQLHRWTKHESNEEE